MTPQTRERRTPIGRDDRALIVRIVTPARPACAQARDVRPEREEDPDAEPGRGSVGRLLLTLRCALQPSRSRAPAAMLRHPADILSSDAGTKPGARAGLVRAFGLINPDVPNCIPAASDLD